MYEQLKSMLTTDEAAKIRESSAKEPIVAVQHQNVFDGDNSAASIEGQE